MRLYYLRAKDHLLTGGQDGDRTNPFDPWFNTCTEMVVRAPNEISARIIAQENGGEEREDSNFDMNKEIWTDPNYVDCWELTKEGNEGVVVRYVDRA